MHLCASASKASCETYINISQQSDSGTKSPFVPLSHLFGFASCIFRLGVHFSNPPRRRVESSAVLHVDLTRHATAAASSRFLNLTHIPLSQLMVAAEQKAALCDASLALSLLSQNAPTLICLNGVEQNEHKRSTPV